MKKISFVFSLFFILFMIQNIYSIDDSGIEITSDYEGVKVYADGVYKGETSQRFGQNRLVVHLSPGKHTIYCEYGVYVTPEETIIVKEGIIEPFEISFKNNTVKVEDEGRSGAVATALTGNINIKSQYNGAAVAVNGWNAGTINGMKSISDYKAGKIVLEVYFDKRKADEYLKIEFDLPPGQTVNAYADFDKHIITVDLEYDVNFISIPAGGTLFMDNKEVGELPLSIKLNLGRHLIRIEKDGYKTHTENFIVDKNMILRRELVPIDRQVTIITEPSGAKIYLDSGHGESYIGLSPYRGALDEGTYTVRAVKSDNFNYASEPVSFNIGINESYKRVVIPMNKSAAVLTVVKDREYIPPYDIYIDDIRIGNISGSIRNKSIPAGYRKIIINNQTYNFNFIEGHSYTLTPLYPIPFGTEPYYTSAYNLPGYQRPPSRPSLEEERIKTEQTILHFDSPYSIYGAGMGGFFGLLGGIGPSINASNTGTEEEPDIDFGKYAATHLGIIAGTSLAGWLVGTIVDSAKNPDKKVSYKNDEAAAARNKEKLAAWREEAAPAEVHNRKLIDEANLEVERQNEKNSIVIEKNENRGILIIKDETTGSQKEYNISG